MITRRAMLSKLVLGVTAVASGAIPVRLADSSTSAVTPLAPLDDRFLDEISAATAQLFWECAHPVTGMVLDRACSTAAEVPAVSSIAGTGFGLSALCIMDRRGWRDHEEILTRVRATLRFIHTQLPQVNGFYYHFVDWRNGTRAMESEVSSIDTTMLLCGVLMCRAHFADAEVERLATAIFERVNWRWLLRSDNTLGHGWRPESGFLQASWGSYSEHLMLYLLALGASERGIPPESWHAWRRPVMNYRGHRYVSGDPELFTHQYSHAWFDFRRTTDRYLDYLENSVRATRAHREFCAELATEFPQYDTGLWGITASESPVGYAVWGGPERCGPIDGSVVPCAAGGSLPFLLPECLRTLRLMRERHEDLAWGRFGFTDAFNPRTRWVAPVRISINSGITLLMAENARSGFVWQTFMRNPEAQAGMARAGFRVPPPVV